MISNSSDKASLNRYSPSIHPSYARLLCAHLSGQGVDLEALCRSTALEWSELVERQHFVSFEQFRGLANAAIKELDCPWLALNISSIIQVSSHGPLGYGALAAKTAKDAFRLVERMMHTRIILYRFTLDIGDETTIFRIDERISTGELQEFIQVMLLGSLFDMLEKTTGKAVSGLTVKFPFASPPWRDRYEQRFSDVKIEFGADVFEVYMPSSLLEQPCFTADEFAYKNAVRECEALLERQDQGSDVAQQVLLELSGQGAPYPTLEELANRHHVSARTFIRKLKSEGVSYQGLLDEVRKDVATWELQNSSLPIDQIAEKLGFADTSNFSRVFRRWFSCTPSEFRAR